MGESSSNVYYILCDVRLSWLTYLENHVSPSNACKPLAVSNVLLHTQDLSGITFTINRITTEFLIWTLLGFSMIHDQ